MPILKISLYTTKQNGVATKSESNLSKKPPCPGIIEPLSLTPASLFNLLPINH